MEAPFVEIISPGIRIRVDLAELTDVLRELGEEELLATTLQQISAGKFGIAQRNRIIVRLAGSQDIDKFRIAACFGITTELVHQLAAAVGIHGFPSRYELRERITSRRIAYLKTPEGQKQVQELMARVARDPNFWAKTGRRHQQRGRLITRRIVEALGFQVTARHRCQAIWRDLIAAGIITESRLPGIVITYGLNEDPRHFLRRIYGGASPTRQEDVVQIVGQRLNRPDGGEPFSQSTLSDYLRDNGLPRKKRGAPDPYWLRGRKRQAGR